MPELIIQSDKMFAQKKADEYAEIRDVKPWSKSTDKDNICSEDEHVK